MEWRVGPRQNGAGAAITMKTREKRERGRQNERYFYPFIDLDLALIAVILFVMIRSVGRGFVSSFIHLLGLAAACIVAALLSGKAAAWLYDGYLAERLQTAVSDTLRQKLQTFAELLDRIDPTDTITGAAGDALRTVMVALLTMVAFLVIFLVAMVIVRALAKLTRNVNRVPVVGGVNRVLGGVLGAAEAFLLCYLIGMAAAVLITFSENEWSWLNTAVVQKSTILNWFVQLISCVNPARERAITIKQILC